MRLAVLLLVLVAAFVAIECGHTFLGTNVFKRLMFHRQAKYSSLFLRKRVEYFSYTLPSKRYYTPVIQGILAFDLEGSKASANVTKGGVGHRFVTLRMKSERDMKLNYDIYIYV